jgi:hypothetical protein
MSTSHVHAYWSARAHLRECAEEGRRFLSNPAVAQRFAIERSAIDALLRETEWWHGTGTKKYVPVADSKYSAHCKREAEDVLGSLLSGLRARRDPYLDGMLYTSTAPTVSLSRTRMYAKAYALRHFCDGEALQYEFGSRDFWYKCITTRMSIEMLRRYIGAQMLVRIVVASVRSWLDARYRNERARRLRHRREQLTRWSSDIRADGRDVLSSDIPGNVPVLIGIRRGAVPTIAAGPPNLALYESRTEVDIPPSAFTHIEVPLANVDTIRSRMVEFGPLGTVPVVAIEFGDLLQSEQPFGEILRPDVSAAIAASRTIKRSQTSST